MTRLTAEERVSLYFPVKEGPAIGYMWSQDAVRVAKEHAAAEVEVAMSELVRERDTILARAASDREYAQAEREAREQAERERDGARAEVELLRELLREVRAENYGERHIGDRGLEQSLRDEIEAVLGPEAPAEVANFDEAWHSGQLDREVARERERIAWEEAERLREALQAAEGALGDIAAGEWDGEEEETDAHWRAWATKRATSAWKASRAALAPKNQGEPR